MKKLLILSLMVVGVIVLGSYFYGAMSKKQSENNSLKTDKEFDANRAKATYDLRSLEFNNQGLPIDKSIGCKSISGEVTDLADIIKNGDKLIFCIPESVCNPCHENTLNQLKYILKEIGSKNLIVLVNKPQLRASVVDFKDKGNDLKILGIDYNKLKINIHYVPFMFIFSKKSICENLYVTNSFDTELNKKYITSIKKRYSFE